MIIETGASINIIDENTFSTLKKSKPISLKGTRTKLLAYRSQNPLPVIGKFETTIDSKGRITVASIHVVKGSYGSLLSYPTATELNLITLHVNKVDQPKSMKDQIAQKFPCIFNGLVSLTMLK